MREFVPVHPRGTEPVAPGSAALKPAGWHPSSPGSRCRACLWGPSLCAGHRLVQAGHNKQGPRQGGGGAKPHKTVGASLPLRVPASPANPHLRACLVENAHASEVPAADLAAHCLRGAAGPARPRCGLWLGRWLGMRCLHHAGRRANSADGEAAKLPVERGGTPSPGPLRPVNLPPDLLPM